MVIRTGFTAPIGSDLDRSLERASENGFDFVEVLLDGRFARSKLEPRSDRVAEAFDERGLDAIVHLPFTVDVGSPFEPVREGAVAELTAGLDLCAGIGARKAVFHPSTKAWDRGWEAGELRGWIAESTATVAERARDRGIKPCVENVAGPYDFPAFEGLLERVETQATFDTGHAHLAGLGSEGMAAFLVEYGHRVSHVHLSDTRGERDEHLPVGMGVIEFGRALEPLFEGWSGTITHEVATDEFAHIESSAAQFDRRAEPLARRR